MLTKTILGRTLTMAAFAATVAIGVPAFAGECPADQVGTNPLADRATEPSGVSDNVLGTIDLAQEPVAIEGRKFRLRELIIQPGGIVPFHSHDDRPAQIYVVKGEVTEYSSDCLVPIVHKAGEVSQETHVVAHWWKNTGSEPAVLISADLLHDETDANTM